jgi:hypothetical protein
LAFHIHATGWGKKMRKFLGKLSEIIKFGNEIGLDYL